MILTILTLILSFIFANGNFLQCSSLSLQYCNNCPLSDRICLISCRECYTYNTFIQLFFNDFDGCLFEHCQNCPFDTYGCRTLCRICIYPPPVTTTTTTTTRTATTTTRTVTLGPPCSSFYNPCINGGICYLGAMNSQQCQCINGFTGRSCQDPPTSTTAAKIRVPGPPGICQNGGTSFIENRVTIICECPRAFKGNLCEQIA